MDRFFGGEVDAKAVNPLALAFVGDSVYDLFVREKLVCENKTQVNRLHSMAVHQVKASSQKDAAKKIQPLLTKDENDVFLRCRNAHSGHIPKNATVEDYHYATALEGVFGYIYLKGDIERLRELVEIING